MKVDERVLVANRGGLLRGAQRLVGLADAEDVVQDAFERAWRATTARPGTDAGAWLNRIARNVAYDTLRKRARTFDLPSRDETESVETAVLQRESTAALNGAVGELPAPQRRAFVLHDIAGYSSREIAQLDGIAHNTVRTRLFRARRALREALRSEAA
jgi:RNA polymerase sigma factor (sigma-70 family)